MKLLKMSLLPILYAIYPAEIYLFFEADIRHLNIKYPQLLLFAVKGLAL